MLRIYYGYLCVIILLKKCLLNTFIYYLLQPLLL